MNAARVGLGCAALLCVASCGGTQVASEPHLPHPPSAPNAQNEEAVTGFGRAGSAAGTPVGRATPLGAAGEVGGRAVRLTSAFVLTPDVEGPVELHVFEARVAEGDVCPAGLEADPPGVTLHVMLPDTRRGDEPELTRWTVDGERINVRAVRVEIGGTARPATPTFASIDVQGSGTDRITGTMPAVVCRDDREAP